MSGAGAVTWLALAVAGGLGASCRYAVDTRVGAAVAARRARRATLTGPTEPTEPTGRASRTGQAGGPLAAMPLGTVVVNVSACFLLGVLAGLTTGGPLGPAASWAPAWLSPVLGTGLLGGYSTFSTASVEGARLVLAGHGLAAVTHAALMTLATLAAAVLGILAAGALT